jgi:hypothetical protein
VHRILENGETVFAVSLRGIHRDVGVANQVVRRVGRPMLRDADARTDKDFLALYLDRALDLVKKALGDHYLFR